MSSIHLRDLAAQEVWAQSVLASLQAAPPSEQATVIALSGALGAGKTTFVQALARALGVQDVVQSPTFSIYKIYATSNETFKTLVHMDAYRIESLAELGPLRFAEILAAKETLVCIEWAEQIAPALPSQLVTIVFSEAPPEALGRTVTVTGLTLLD